MKNNLAFDSIDEIAINIKQNPVVEKTRVFISPSVQQATKKKIVVKIGNYFCRGKNQKILGNFWNSKDKEILVDIPLSKRPGLDMAIKAVGLVGKVKATQQGSVVKLIRL
jgi:hypothetical protein